MRFRLALTIILLSINSVSADYWTQKASMPVPGRFLAVSFAINDIGYIGCGFLSGYQYSDDFWGYDPATNTWSQKADFPGGLRSGACGFSLGTKGYIGLGGDPSGGFYTDFWEYDPQFNSWTIKPAFPGDERFETKSCSAGNSGFVSGGFNSMGEFNDMWKFDSNTNSWSSMGTLPLFMYGYKLFGIGNEIYHALGHDLNLLNDQLWSFDLSSGTWSQKANFPGQPRDLTSEFTINGNAYIGLGTGFQGPNNVLNDFWKYNPVINSWSQVSSLPAVGRNGSSSFQINNKGYIVCGKNATGTINDSVYNETWEYTPDSTTGNPEFLSVDYTIKVFPNPATAAIFLEIDNSYKNLILNIFNSTGQKILSQSFSKSGTFEIDISKYKCGIYYYSFTNGQLSVSSGTFSKI